MSPHLRLATPHDAVGIHAIYAPIVCDTPVSFALVPPSHDEIVARVTKTLIRFPWLVCTVQERLLGYAYAGSHNERAAYQWAVNVSVYLDAKARRLGIGRSLYQTLFSILRLQGFYRAYAGITLPNGASVGLHESLGFRSVGTYEKVGYKQGAWHDVGYWQLTLQPSDGEPARPRPRPLPSLQDCRELREALQTGSEKLTKSMAQVAAALNV